MRTMKNTKIKAIISKIIVKIYRGVMIMDLKTFLQYLHEDEFGINRGQKELDDIMDKVRSGEKLTDDEREKLSVALDAAKDERDKTANEKIDKIMSKIAKGVSLKPQEEDLLAIALAAAKK